jgi:peptide/nickel transport system permease protein
MLRYFARRLAHVVIVLVGVSLVTFMMVRMIPGDPVLTMMGELGGSPEQVAVLRKSLGLDDPLPVQYWRFVSRAVSGDFGRSIQTQQVVTQMISSQLGSTVQLTATALLLGITAGVSLGIVAAYRRRSWIDSTLMLVATLGISTPSFALGLVLILVFSVLLRWIPILGQSGFVSLILPMVTLGVGLAAVLARFTRSSLLDVLDQDYVRTARSKGLSNPIVVLRHALPNALIPVVTTIGLQLGSLLAGTIVVETVFARQGLGRLLVIAITARDYPVVQALVLYTAVVFVVINLIVDFLYGVIDTRVHAN